MNELNGQTWDFIQKMKQIKFVTSVTIELLLKSATTVAKTLRFL